jgi:hypothetical protein
LIKLYKIPSWQGTTSSITADQYFSGILAFTVKTLWQFRWVDVAGTECSHQVQACFLHAAES